MPYGAIVPPTITPLRAPIAGHTSAHIDEGTYIELETESPYAVIYFTTDGGKPNPFTKSLGGVEQTFRYRAPFTLKPGRRCVKAIAVSRNGIQESRVVSKNFTVESLGSKSSKKLYLEDCSSTVCDLLDDDLSSDSESESEKKDKKGKEKDKKKKGDGDSKKDKKEKDKTPEQSKPESKFGTSFQPENHAGTQINLWGGQPPFPGSFDVRGPNATGTSFGYGQTTGALTQSMDSQQMQMLTSQLIQKIDQSHQMTLSDVRTMVKDLECKTLKAVEVKPAPPAPPVIQPFEPELTAVSAGGDLKKQLQHVYAHLLDLGKRDANLRAAISMPLGAIASAEVEDTDDGYTLTVVMNKPGLTGASKPRAKKPPTPKPEPAKVEEPQNTGIQKLEVAKPIVQVNPVAEGPKIEVETELKVNPEDEAGPALKMKTEADKKPAELVESSFFETEEYVQEGTHKPAGEFNVDDDCTRLNKAVRGLGTDEDVVCNILSNRSISQRIQIAERYKLMFGKEFAKEFCEELKPSAEFKKMVTALLLRPEDYDATELRNAMKGPGSDALALIGIICTRTQEQMKMIREAYVKLFPTRQLDKDVESETTGELRRILLSLLQASRPDSKQFDRTVAKQDARQLYDAGIGDKSGMNTDTFNMILATRSNAHLRAVFEEYEKISSVSVIDSLKKEMHGDILQAYLALVRCIKNKPHYFAYALFKAMKGIGTVDSVLIRIVISRCEVDMVQIKEQYLELEDNTKKESVGQWISVETKGHYRTCLLTLVGEQALLKAKKK